MTDKIEELEIKLKKKYASASLSDGCAVTVGSFDGVHLGHRALIGKLSSEAERLAVPACVFTFGASDRPKENEKLLASEEEKEELLFASGADIVCCADFSELRGINADEFVKELLIGRLGAKSIVCGYDFRFGKDNGGNAGSLAKSAEYAGIGFAVVPPVKAEGETVSSTLIRRLISDGEIEKANRLLARHYSFSAAVEQGAHIGRTLGLPTVNQLFPSDEVAPKFGVYAVKCDIEGKTFGGVANIGVRPTVGRADRPICETNIFGCDADLYGKTIKISFLHFIRKEKRFASLALLSESAKRDAETAKKLLSEGDGK